jgi:hypothetical protein
LIADLPAKVSQNDASKGPLMKMRITITDEDGKELASHIFEIAGQNDYQQATNYIWSRVRETLAAEAGDDPNRRIRW